MTGIMKWSVIMIILVTQSIVSIPANKVAKSSFPTSSPAGFSSSSPVHHCQCLRSLTARTISTLISIKCKNLIGNSGKNWIKNENTPGKSQWSKYIGKDVNDVVKLLQSENPEQRIVVWRVDEKLKLPFIKRVMVVVKEDGKAIEILKT